MDMSTKLTSQKRYRNCTGRRFCCYKGCSSDQKITRAGAISFFSFPIKDTERCSIWITYSGREEFRYLTPRELQEKRICEIHFHRRMFSNDFRTNLVKNAVPIDCSVVTQEPIQIDDDDEFVEEEIYLSDEGESGIVSETSSNNITLESDKITSDIVKELRSLGADVNSDALCRPTILNNGGNVSSIPTKEKSKSQDVLNVNEAQTPISENSPSEFEGSHGTPVKAQSVSAIITEDVDKDITKDTSKSVESSKTNTKFHNLPPQTTQTDFYFQQCPNAEETNSFSEPPDGELPLFVQQDTDLSMADERANSEASEPPSKKRKKDKDNDDLSGQMRDAMKQLLNITALLNSNEDEFELFGKSVALQLKKMSLCTALTVQAKIQQLLSEYRINDIIKKTAKPIECVREYEGNKTEQKATTEEGKSESTSLQLSLTCGSDSSDNETTEIG